MPMGGERRSAGAFRVRDLAWELPITENAKRFLQHLVAWFDTSIDWASPGDADDYWDEAELRRFKEAASKGLLLLKQELPGPGFEFEDGMHNPSLQRTASPPAER